MKYIQILDGVMCTSDIDSCCSDYGIAPYIYMVKQAIEIIHFIVPIILIVMAGIQLFIMVTSPDDPQGKKMKSLTNKFLAAVIVFFVPFIVDLVVSIIPDSFSLSSCWQSADDIVTLMNEMEEENGGSPYDPYIDNRKKIGDDYGEIVNNIYVEENEEEDEEENNSENSNNAETPTGYNNAPEDVNQKRQEVINYAKQFLGNPYVYGGNSLTSGIDCSGFTQAIYANFGYSLQRSSSAQASDSRYKDVALSDIQPGDLLFYLKSSGVTGHVSMYIGNGKVIHASSPKVGITINNYGYRTPYKAKRIISG